MGDEPVTLVLRDDPRYGPYWECSACGGKSNVTRAIERDRVCRCCGAYAEELDDLEGELLG